MQMCHVWTFVHCIYMYAVLITKMAVKKLSRPQPLKSTYFLAGMSRDLLHTKEKEMVVGFWAFFFSICWLSLCFVSITISVLQCFTVYSNALVSLQFSIKMEQILGNTVDVSEVSTGNALLLNAPKSIATSGRQVTAEEGKCLVPWSTVYSLFKDTSVRQTPLLDGHLPLVPAHHFSDSCFSVSKLSIRTMHL